MSSQSSGNQKKNVFPSHFPQIFPWQCLVFWGDFAAGHSRGWFVRPKHSGPGAIASNPHRPQLDIFDPKGDGLFLKKNLWNRAAPDWCILLSNISLLVCQKDWRWICVCLECISKFGDVRSWAMHTWCSELLMGLLSLKGELGLVSVNIVQEREGLQ